MPPKTGRSRRGPTRSRKGPARPLLEARIFEAIFERSLDPVLIIRLDGTVIRANPAAAFALGFSTTELVGRGRGDLVVENEALGTAVAERARSGNVRAELTIRRADGSTFPAQVTSAVIEAGLESFAYVLFRDLTAEREAARALVESEQRFAAIFDRSPISMALSRLPETTYVAANDAFRALFELGDVDVVGRTGVDLGIASAAAWARTAGELLQRGSLRNREVTRTTRAGHQRRLLLSMEPVSIGGQRHVISIAVDITEKQPTGGGGGE